MTLYNSAQKDFPQEICTIGEITLSPNYSIHAQNAAEKDRYGCIVLPSLVKFSGKDIFEVELTDGSISKIVIRIPYEEDDYYDICLVLEYTSRVIKTVWLNEATDNHVTLDLSKYTLDTESK
jgi:hypothetical protein